LDPLHLDSFPTRRSSDLALYLKHGCHMHRNLLFVLACYFLIAGSCSPPEGAQQHVTYTEPGDPHPVSDSVWAKVPYGLHATFVSDRKSTRLNSSHVKISY